MNIKLIRYLGVALLLLTFTGLAFAKGEGDRKNARLSKTLGEPVYTRININNISTWIKNDGETDIDRTGNSGFVFPKGSGRAAVFQSGFLWGGKVDGEFRVGGSVYRQGTVAGRILPNGQAASPDDADVRIYRVRRDWEAGSLQAELADGDGDTEQEIRDQYQKDWNEWPASQGAPYEDVDGNGSYDPDVDIPGVPGADQTVWFVANDLDPAQTLFMYGSNPMGIEEQVTTWGYKATGALGNMIFRKFLIINKNAQQKAFEEMYVSMWSDPDLGDAGDDFVGCDTTLSLGYCYNANATDAVYNPFPPPAVGFDFFQGPMVDGAPTDTAIFKGKYIPGKKNLPMSAFYFFINSDPIYTDPTQGNYERGTLGFYNLFRGRISTSGQPFVDPNTNLETKFTLAGDPITGTGWIDGQLHPPGDRRLGMVAGPFNMAYGDTQEVVVAEIAAGASAGIDRLLAVDLLKDYSKAAQIAYDRLFDLPRPPALPKTDGVALDKEIVLYWGGDRAAVELTEGYANFGYTFQGYNVYQYDQPSNQVRRIATFDVIDDVKKVVDLDFDPVAGIPVDKVVAFGDDTGIKRSMKITTDAFKSGLPLLNGSRYFFAVTAYAYNENPPFGPKILENPIQTIQLVPQSPNPGVRYESIFGQQLVVSKTGAGDGEAVVTVVDPTKVTGHNYQVSFTETANGIVWSVKDLTANKDIVTNFANQSDDDDYPIVDGLKIKITGPTDVGVKQGSPNVDEDPTLWGWDIPAGSTRRFTWAGGDPNGSFGLESFGNTAPEGGHGTLGYASIRWWFGDGNLLVGSTELKNIELRLAKVDFTGDYDPPFDMADPNMSYGYRFLRAASAAPAKPEFAPFILNPVGGTYPYQEFAKNVPLSAWNVDDPANPKRLAVGFLENNGAAGLVDGKYWPGSNANITNNAIDTREWFFIYDEPYSETADPKFQVPGAVSDARMMYIAMWNRRGAAPFSPTGSGVDKFLIFPNKPNSPNVKFTFTAPSVTVDPELAKEDIEKINVFPNPYYGVNSQELNKYQRFVTFNHLPQKATLRIFNLAGQLVRVIAKDAPEQFLRWDLSNESQLPVASGLYIVHVDMPDLGKTKILKVAIIQEQQVLDRF